MALSYPYSVQQNQLLKKDMNFQIWYEPCPCKRLNNHHHHDTLDFNNTYQSGNHANFLCGISAFTPLCSCSHKMKLNTIKT